MNINQKDRPSILKSTGYFRDFNPYDAIFKTDPTVFVGLEHAKLGPVQVLFQDAACTVPVEEIGDPIGGVIDPRDLSVVATQETDANRPLWGGVGEGGIFDGLSNLLEIPTSKFNVGDLDLFSIYMSISKVNASHRSTFFTSFADGADTNSAGIALFPPFTDRETRYQYHSGGGSSNSAINRPLPDNMSWVPDVFFVGVEHNKTSNTANVRINSFEESNSVTVHTEEPNPLQIGGNPFGGPTYFEGTSKFFVTYSSNASEVVPSLVELAQ